MFGVCDLFFHSLVLGELDSLQVFGLFFASYRQGKSRDYSGILLYPWGAAHYDYSVEVLILYPAQGSRIMLGQAYVCIQ